MSKPRRSPASRRGAATAPVVACFGEILWDCLPRGLFLGGAPANAGYHLAQQGLRVLPVSAVGRDFLGDEALRRIGGWGGVDTRFIARPARRPTGTVRAEIDRGGVATYRFAGDVAWDRIPVTAELENLTPAPAAVVYGTLALRETPNRRALASLFAQWPEALRVVDLNFREPFATREAVSFALRFAQFVKLNEDELATLMGRRARTPEALRRSTDSFARRHDIDRVCVTAGARGAGLWWRGEWHWEPGREVRVRDTVGAGDAFLGGLLGALLGRGAKPASALASACRMGEFVASRDGATPPYTLGARFQPTDPA